MSRKTDIQNLIINYTRRLQKLKEQQALKGQNADADLLIEIEDTEAQLEALQAELVCLADEAEPAPVLPTRVKEGATMSNEEKPKEGGRSINTGGGAYIEGMVNTGGGDFVGRDQMKTVSPNAANIAKMFEQIYTRIETRPHTSPEDKADLKTDVQEVQAEVKKGDQADESFLNRRLRNIQRMAPDILDVLLATLTSPTVAFSAAVTKVAHRMKAATGNS